jgi:equilibrative nucleoside transporter 1/2/3
MMKNSFFLAWQFLTALAFVFFITFLIFPALITDTKLEFL